MKSLYQYVRINVMLIEIFIDNTSRVHMILKCQVNNANMICKTQMLVIWNSMY